MRRTLITLSLLLSPVAAFALNYKDATQHFTDAPFSKAETAGISVLMHEGVVRGNPDGSFAPERTLNRAEFMKIAMMSHAGDPVEEQESNCFPDVRESQWFEVYVCWAKYMGVVEGNPDGLFHPERAVNYAEALKILGELFGYTLPEGGPNVRWAWYTPYLMAAEEHGVTLPENIDPAAELTRGQMARLTAAFLAEWNDELDTYRNAEKGIFASSSRSSSVSMASSVSSLSSSSESSAWSVSSASSVSGLFPAIQHLLLVDNKTPPVIDGTFTSLNDVAELRGVKVVLRREIKSLWSLTLVDQAGTHIVDLKLSTDNNSDHRKWEVSTVGSVYQFPKGQPVKLGLIATLRNTSDGGQSGELFEFESWYLDSQEVTTGAYRQLLPTDQHAPLQQTVIARITGMKNVLSSGVLQPGSNKTIATFNFTGDNVGDAYATLVEVVLKVVQTNVALSNVRIGGNTVFEQSNCGIENGQVMRMSCGLIPGNFKYVDGERMVSITADVALSGGSEGTLQLIPESRGSIGQNGAIRWSDGSTQFNWIESTAALENGPMWTVK